AHETRIADAYAYIVSTRPQRFDHDPGRGEEVYPVAEPRHGPIANGDSLAGHPAVCDPSPVARSIPADREAREVARNVVGSDNQAIARREEVAYQHAGPGLGAGLTRADTHRSPLLLVATG